ncbi:MAG: inorganic phosphate transporter, partial [Elusimicrobiota bacterium]
FWRRSPHVGPLPYGGEGALWRWAAPVLEPGGHQPGLVLGARALDGLGANLAGVTTLGVCTAAGFPVSSTQALVSSVMGAAAAKNFKAVRWMVAVEIIASWCITLPVCAGAGYVLAKLLLPS